MADLTIDQKPALRPVLLLGGAAALLAGVSMLSSPDQFVMGGLRNLNLIRVLGGLCLILFWVALIINIKRLTDTTPGLTLDEQGFVSTSGFYMHRDKSAGEKILWKDIRQIREFNSHKKRFVEIEFHEQNERSTTTRDDNGKTDDLLQIFEGPPYLLSPDHLKIDFDILLQHFIDYRQSAHQQSQQERS